MRFSTFCIQCKKEILFTARARDREKLSTRMGDKLELTCHHCHGRARYHVNKIYAITDKVVALKTLAGFVIGLTFCVVYFSQYLTGPTYVYSILSILGVFVLSGIIYVAIKHTQKYRCQLFNNSQTG